MNKLIALSSINGEMRVSSIELAEHLEVDYRSTHKLIEKHKSKFLEFGELGFKITLESRKKPVFLNEDQSIFLMTLSRNSEAVINCKHNLVMAFSKLRKKQAAIDANHAKVEYQLMRESGKDARSILSDEIEKLNETAKAAGSQNPKRHSNITSAIYKSLFITKIKVSKIRDLLTPIQLSQLQTIELIIAELISEELAKETHYSEFYPLIKKKLSELEIPKSKILADEIDHEK